MKLKIIIEDDEMMSKAIQKQVDLYHTLSYSGKGRIYHIHTMKMILIGEIRDEAKGTFFLNEMILKDKYIEKKNEDEGLSRVSFTEHRIPKEEIQ